MAPSTLCGSPVPGESNQVLLSHLLQHRSCMLHRPLRRQGGCELDWLTHKVRCVRGSLPPRAMRASGDSPCHLSAKRHLLATYLRLMASFRCMLLTLQSGLERLTPKAHWVPGYPMVLPHSPHVAFTAHGADAVGGQVQCWVRRGLAWDADFSGHGPVFRFAWQPFSRIR